MKQLVDFSSRFRILKGGKISLVVSALLGSVTLSVAAPSGGVVTSGSATINQSGKTTNINQSTQKASINWQKFNISVDETVNFNQPNVNSITLNRIVGNERSVINGALNANGQVWILNSNGVLFGKNASINTAGLLATTKELSDIDFQAGNYNFKGSSTASVINLGEIDISNSGYAALLANTVSNEGTIKAVKGKVHLVGANEVTINFNGNSIVDLTVDKGVLDALVENKGAIYADGGEIYLTTNAVDELLKGVVNNEGIIEANSFEGVTGYVELFAHGGEAKIGGSIEAIDGFVETSGKEFTFNDAKIEAGEWLIDPVNVTIDDSLATAIETALGTGDVTIETDTPDYSDVDTSSGESAGDGNIYVNSEITWDSYILTLNAGNNIYINENLIATGTGALALYYGQSTANGTGSSYTVADDVDILISLAESFTWKKGSAGNKNYLTLDNGKLRFGSVADESYDSETYMGSAPASIASTGMLLGPWYYDNVTIERNDWYPLTYENYPLDFMLGVNGSGYNDGDLYDTGGEEIDIDSQISNFSINVAKYYEKTGTLTVNMEVATSAGTLPITHEYTLEEDATYVKGITTIKNTTGSDIDNTRIWVGTQDDYVAEADDNYKTRGNIDENGFEAVANQTSDISKALIVSEDSLDSEEGAAVLFYSTTNGTNTIVSDEYEWDNIVDADPTDMPDISESAEDGSYALYLNMGTLANNNQRNVTWYYGAAPVRELDNMINSVGQSAGVTPSTPTSTGGTTGGGTTTSPTTQNEVEKIVTTIVNQNVLTINPPKVETPNNVGQNVAVNFGMSGNQMLISQPIEGQATQRITLGQARQMQLENGVSGEEVRVPLSRSSMIELVNGGVNLPLGIEQEFYVSEEL